MSGFARAELFNTCKLTSHKHWGEDPVPNKTLQAVYMLTGKAGSSTIRTAVGFKKETCFPCQESADFTRFTVVRDPLERAISSFWEEGWTCRQNATHRDTPHEYNPLKAAHRTHVLHMFERFVNELERDSLCWGPHEERQTRRLPDPSKYPMHWIGSLETLEQDWHELANYKANVAGIQWPALPPAQRVKPKRVHMLLNTTLLPPALAQRVCNVYKEDYCCLGLPVPDVCKLTC